MPPANSVLHSCSTDLRPVELDFNFINLINLFIAFDFRDDLEPNRVEIFVGVWVAELSGVSTPSFSVFIPTSFVNLTTCSSALGIRITFDTFNGAFSAVCLWYLLVCDPSRRF